LGFLDQRAGTRWYSIGRGLTAPAVVLSGQYAPASHRSGLDPEERRSTPWAAAIIDLTDSIGFDALPSISRGRSLANAF